MHTPGTAGGLATVRVARTRFRGLVARNSPGPGSPRFGLALTVKSRLLADGTSKNHRRVMPGNSTSHTAAATPACTTVSASPGGERSPHAWLAESTTSKSPNGFLVMRTLTTRITIWI